MWYGVSVFAIADSGEYGNSDISLSTAVSAIWKK